MYTLYLVRDEHDAEIPADAIVYRTADALASWEKNLEDNLTGTFFINRDPALSPIDSVIFNRLVSSICSQLATSKFNAIVYLQMSNPKDYHKARYMANKLIECRNGEEKVLREPKDTHVLGEMGTPAAKWRENNEPDPFLGIYDVPRSELLMGNLTDDEMANELFLYDHRGGLSSMMYLKAGQDRIRWLSRQLCKAEAQLKEKETKVAELTDHVDQLDKRIVELEAVAKATVSATATNDGHWASCRRGGTFYYLTMPEPVNREVFDVTIDAIRRDIGGLSAEVDALEVYQPHGAFYSNDAETFGTVYSIVGENADAKLLEDNWVAIFGVPMEPDAIKVIESATWQIAYYLETGANTDSRYLKFMQFMKSQM